MRPIWQIIMFFGIGSLIWLTAHYYMGRRLISSAFAGRRRARHLAWALFLVLTAAGPLVMISGRVLDPSPLLATLRWFGYVGMGVSTVLFAFVVLRDLAWWLGRGAHGIWRRVGPSDAADRASDPDRRAFLFNTTSAAVLATTAGCSGVGFYSARRDPELRDVVVDVADLHHDLDGLRIAHLSDVHVGPTIRGEDLARMVRAINEQKPDMVVITGDLIDGFVDDLRDEIAVLSELSAPHGVYFCTGNHEYYWDAPSWCAALREMGVRVLNNEHEVISAGSAKLLVAGVTDFRAGAMVPGHASDPKKALEGAPAVDYRLVLAHQPKSIEAVAEAGYDLQISGHTHGGQYFPFNMFVVLAHPFTAGLHRFRETDIFVSTGAGYWGPPNRLGVPSEIPILELKRA